MKISIWQQFASNHSASFTIVGAFQDSDSATKAATVVRDAMKSISNWYEAHPDIKEAVIARQQKEPTEAELEISRKFDIPAYRALDWLAQCGHNDTLADISNIVYKYENLIFMTTETWESCYGWAGPTLFDDLIKKFTQNVFLDVEDYFRLLVSLTWLTPDEQTAEVMGSICRRHTRPPAIHNGLESPWIILYLRDQPGGEALLRDHQIYLAAKHAERTSETHQIESKGLNVIEKHQVEIKIREVVAALYDIKDSAITVEGRQLALRGLDFYNLAIGLPAMIKWLTEQGCSDIKYQFEQIKLNV